MIFAEAESWERFAQLWGPAVPMFAILIFYIHRLVFVTIPRGFRGQRKVMHEEFAEQTRVLRQHSEMLTLIYQRLDDVNKPKHPPRRKKQPSQ